MRDAHPLVGHFPIDLARAAVIELVEVVIHRAQAVAGQALAAFRHAVRLVLELREHRLAEHRRAEMLEQRTDQRDLRLLIARVLLAQVFGEQDLVAGGSHLGDEDRVIRLGERLILVGIEAVHRVAHLVAEGGQAVIRVLVVEQHIGRGAVRAAAAIRAGTLVLRLVHVDPALRECAARVLHIILAQRLDRFQEHLERLLDVHADFKAVLRFRVQVVHVQNRHADLLLLDGKILVQRPDAAVHRLDQAVVHLFVDLIREHGGLTAAVKVMRAAVEDISLDLTGVGRGNRIAELVVAVHNVGVGRLAHGAILAGEQGEQARVRQLHLFAVFAAGLAQIHIGVGEHFIGGCRRVAGVARHGHQLFLAGRQRVRLHAQHAGEIAVVFRKRRVCDHLLDFALFKRQQLRLHERAGRRHNARQRARAVAHRLIFRVRAVLVVFHHRIRMQREKHLVHPHHRGKRVKHGLAPMAQRARALGKRLGLRLDGGKSLLPRLVAGVNPGQIPRIARVNVLSGQFLFHMSNTLSTRFNFSGSGAARGCVRRAR